MDKLKLIRQRVLVLEHKLEVAQLVLGIGHQLVYYLLAAVR